MAECTAGFEKGTNTATIATGDAGDATAWNTVTIGANATAIYDTAHTGSAATTQAAKFATGVTATTSTLAWSTALGTLTGTHYGRLYLYFTAFPAGGGIQLASYTPGGVTLTLSSTGMLTLTDAVVPVATTTAVTLNAWVRTEWMIVQSATVGQLEIKLFNSPDSTTATQTVTSAASGNTGANNTSAAFGINGSAANRPAFWLDQIDAGATSYPGPFSTGGRSQSIVVTGAVNRASFW